MADESSFDIVSRIDLPEVLNAVDQSMREIKQRYDFKGSISSIELNQKEEKMVIISDDEFKLKSVIDVLESKLIKRKVPIKNIDYGKVESASGNTVRQEAKLLQGIAQDKAKDIVKAVKDTKLKVQAQIREKEVRVVGKKKDELQDVITILKGKDFGIDLQFVNYR
ncbi:MAG: YajQ family cyclic di-GMP-binding protein [Nitrospinota bacterium]|nr:YajQ family cyclic di-GMP-binding protein [Nitrospinota bacterium]